jgi:mannose-6-phosphate isomerase-like protein (cupin superfamily)
MNRRVRLVALFVFVAAAGAWLGAQEQAAPRPAVQEFWVQRTPGGEKLAAPNKYHHKISDVKAKHKGQANWRETAVRDGEAIAEYVSVAPGTKLSPRLHPAVPTLFAVFEGEMRWQIENQEEFTAKRGSLVHVPAWTIFSYESTGSAPAVFIEVNVAHYEPVFPATSPAPAALPGRVVTKMHFNQRTPTPYSSTRLTCMPTPTTDSPIPTIRPIRIAAGDEEAEAAVQGHRSRRLTRRLRAVTSIPTTSSGGLS